MRDEYESFDEFIRECGYDPDSDLSPNERQVVNVARAAWKARQIEIDDITLRVAIFKESFEAL